MKSQNQADFIRLGEGEQGAGLTVRNNDFLLQKIPQRIKYLAVINKMGDFFDRY